ncbi:MAG: MlaD family protein [Verrucomicrobiota bacterium]|nr:MlaD family protein [Verrucomicrobiota bacterium]
MKEKGLEFKVGLFVFVGLAVVAALVVQFGRVGEGFKGNYDLTVNFPDASGLLKGSDVLMAGAKVGRVSGGPRLNPSGEGVLVPLRIYDFVKIPIGSKILVGSSGLLGDRYVTIWRPPHDEVKDFLHPGAIVGGTRETGMDDLTREGGELVKDLRGTVANVNTTITRLNEQTLSQTNLDNLKASLEHLKETTTSLSESSQNINGVIEKAGATMDSSKKAADDLQLVLADARKTVQSAGEIFREARTGNGLLGTLLGNEQVARDLQALISNLRAHGVLFYRDSAAKAERAAAAQSTREATPRRGR